MQGVTRIGTRIDDVDNEQILNVLAGNEEDESSHESDCSEEEGIDVDLDEDDIKDEEDDY